ncbi:MAG: tetratricopeptide repeat protein [Candidatus Obscuribacterales bacterium]|nr:tetratricopeptide repeat protein [Candidatus Obscuribacterales bacterium]
MSKDDIESQVKKCREQLKDAQDYYWQSRFQESEALYKECLAKLDHIFPGYSPETATCLQGLGDTYYFQSRYLAALDNYKRLLSMRERLASNDPQGLVTALIKMAKTSEKLNEPEEALRFYRRALEVAQVSLFIGHPVLTSLLESYLAFLKRSQGDSGMAVDIEKKLKMSRERYTEEELSKIMGSPDKQAQGRNAPQEPVEEEAHSVDVDHPLYEGKVPSNSIMGLVWVIVIVIVSLGLSGAGIYFGAQLGEGPQYACVKSGQKYSTLDDDKQLNFTSNNSVDMILSGKTNKISCRTLSNPASGLMFAISDFAGKQPLYVKTGEVITDPTGMLLYTSEAPEWQTINAMRRVASTIKLYVAKYHKMPEQLEEVIAFETKLYYNNPFSGMRNLPSVSSGTYGPDGNVEKVQEVLVATKQLDTRKLDPKLLTLSLPKVVAPGAVLAICLQGDEKKPSSFFVVGADRTGQLFRNCDNSGALVLRGEPDGSSSFVCPLSLRKEGAKENSIIVSIRSAKRFSTLLGMVIADVVFIIPIVIGWVILQKFTDNTMIGYGTMSQKTKKIKGARWLYFPFVMLYIAYTLLVLGEFVIGGIIP